MNESGKFEIYKKKLQGICDENDLVGKFVYDKYPMKLIIQPCKDPDAQMSMLEGVADDGSGYISPDAVLMFYFEDGDLVERIKGTFDMGDTLKNKLKTLFKKMHYLYLQFFHRELITSYGLSHIPRIQDNTTPAAAQPVGYEQVDMDEAISIVRTENFVTLEMLSTKMHISTDDADSLLNELELKGVISEEKEDGTYDVLPWDEPDDEADDTEGGDE